MSTDVARAAPLTTAVRSRFRRERMARPNTLASDLLAGLMAYRLWLNLGWRDIRSRYRRTAIGPFWTVLSTAWMVVGLGFVNSIVWHVDIATYLPFLCAGYISWLMFSNIVNEAGMTLIIAESTIKSICVPYSVFVFRLLTRNVIVFFHNIALSVILMFFFDLKPTFEMLLLPVGLLLVLLNYVWISLLLATICTRFRDIVQLVSSAVSVLFFLTPIFWKPAQLDAAPPVARLILSDGNFVYHMIEAIRAPLLGQTLPLLSVEYLLGAAVVGYALTALFLRRYYGRVAYWL